MKSFFKKITLRSESGFVTRTFQGLNFYLLESSDGLYVFELSGPETNLKKKAQCDVLLVFFSARLEKEYGYLFFPETKTISYIQNYISKTVAKLLERYIG